MNQIHRYLIVALAALALSNAGVRFMRAVDDLG